MSMSPVNDLSFPMPLEQEPDIRARSVNAARGGVAARVRTRGALGWRCVLAALLMAPVAARAGDEVREAQNKLLAKRAAEADCFRKLAETVYGLQLNSNTYMRDFVTESDEIRTVVDAWVKGVRLGSPRYYDDGTCEVDAEVTVAKLVTALKEIHAAHYRGNTVTTTDIERITTTVKSEVIRVTGSGAPRPEIPPLPPGFEDAITPLPSGYVPAPSIPEIWKNVGPQGRLMAERAAEVDAMRRLLEHIKGLRLNSNTLVRDFITESDEISAQANGLVIGALSVGKYLHDDVLIVEVTMEVPVEKVVSRLQELHTQHYHGNSVTTTDISRLTETVHREMVRATGSGVPPARFLEQARQANVVMPDWMGRTVEAVGRGSDPEIGTAQGKLRAVRHAEVEATQKLAEQIYALSISADSTVRDFVATNRDAALEVDALLASAVTGEPKFEGSTAVVSVSLPAANVWSVVNSYLQRAHRRG